jgi:hypothetical protein
MVTISCSISAAVLGRYRRDSESVFSPYALCLRPQSTPLRIRKQQSPRAKLLAQDLILLLQILDDRLLTAVHPPGHR